MVLLHLPVVLAGSGDDDDGLRGSQKQAQEVYFG